MKNNALHILFFILCHLSAKSQDPYIRHYTTLDGLPSNTIYQIYQDSKHFMWLTTDAGVVKFDGSTFVNYRKSEGLSSNDIIKIKEDVYGRIWFSNINGRLNYFYNEVIYNEDNCNFLRLLRSKDFIIDLYQDTDNTIYFYNRFGEVLALDTNQIVKKFNVGNLSSGSPVNWVSCMYMYIHHLNRSSNGDFIFWTSCGLFKIDNFKNPRKYIDISVGVWGVFPSSDSSLIVNTTNRGLLKYYSPTEKVSIPSPVDYYNIKTILTDSKGFLWLACYDKGVYCMKDGVILMHFDIDKALGLFQDHEKNIWVSSMNKGIYIINKDVLNQFQLKSDLFSKEGVLSMTESIDKESIWMSSGNQIYQYSKKRFHNLQLFDDNYSFDILLNYKPNSLLVGIKSNKLFIVDGINSSRYKADLTHSNLAVFQRNVKRVAICKALNEFATFDQTFVTVSDLKNPMRMKKKLYVGERINNVFYNLSNELVVNGVNNFIIEGALRKRSTFLSKYDGSIIVDHKIIEDRLEVYNFDGEKLIVLMNGSSYDLGATFNPSLAGSLVKNVFYYDSTLILTTNRNVFLCKNPFRKTYSLNNSLVPLSVNYERINDVLYKEGSLYVASSNGLSILPYESLIENQSIPPIAYIKEVTINDKRIGVVEDIIQVVGNNRIEVNFGVICFGTNQILYSYKLEGGEDCWHTRAGFYSNIVYQNLPKGNYKFKLKVRKANSDWSDTLEFPIIIMPMFYEYPVFWVFVAIIIAIIIVLVSIQIKNQRLKRIENTHQLIVMEQRALLSMMNPHFIFNSLGSIQGFLLRNRTGEAILYLTQFARLIRQNFSAINVTMIYLDEEIERLKNYLELEQIRMENRFEYFIWVDEVLTDDVFFVPSMIIQPFVENSIWHGIAKIDYKTKGKIAIKFNHLLNDMLKITIEDNGIGIGNSSKNTKKSISHLHLSMGMTKRRLTLLSEKYNCDAHLNITEINPSEKYAGTRVEIFIPITSQKPENENTKENPE